MNLSELLTGAAALIVATLIAGNDSAPVDLEAVVLLAVDLEPVDLEAVAVEAVAEEASPLQPTPAAGKPESLSRSALAPPPLIYGRARMIHAPTPCDVGTFSEGGPGGPYFVADGVPRAGQPFRVDWSTKPTSPSESPAWLAMLLVSYELSTPQPLAALGAPGCHLMVQPEHIMMPQPGSILTQFGGSVSLDWTPRVGLVGYSFYSQLLVSAPGVNAAGFLVSPALHVEVGSY